MNQRAYLKPKTRKEIANEYGISRRTFFRWLKRENIVLDNGLVKSKDLELIYTTFGFPNENLEGKAFK